MIEWKKMPRGSFRYEYDGKRVDVWCMCVSPGVNEWRWTAEDLNNGHFLASGSQQSLDAACEAALARMSI